MHGISVMVYQTGKKLSSVMHGKTLMVSYTGQKLISYGIRVMVYLWQVNTHSMLSFRVSMILFSTDTPLKVLKVWD